MNLKTVCVLCSTEATGTAPYGLDEGWSAWRDSSGRWQPVCPRHREAVGWASLRHRAEQPQE